MALALVAPTLDAGACPYCPPTDATLSEKLSESDAACIVNFLDAKNGAELSMQTTRFQVIQLMKPSPHCKVDEIITVPIGVTANPGDTYLLMGQLKQDEIEWSLPLEIDEVSREYVKQAPSPEFKPAEARLAYFLKFLDVKNPLISNDAFGEFARAEFQEVERLVANESKEKLRLKVRKWLEDPNPQVDVRRAFYGMLLGLCGNDDDAKYLESKILAPIPTNKFRFGIDGMMGGYLLLRGQPGLTLLMEKKFVSLPKEIKVDDPRLTDASELRKTLAFLWDYRRSQFDEDSLRMAMRRFLNHIDFAELAIIDLARWKDWKSLEPLIAAYGRTPWETRSGKEKIVAFALSCLKDAKSNPTGTASKYAAKAQEFLKGLDPDLVQSVKQSASGPIAPPAPEKKPKKPSDGTDCSSIGPYQPVFARSIC